MRIALTLAVIGVWLLGVLAMWRGWRARARRTQLADLPALPDLPGADVIAPLVGIYLGTTYAGQWLERITSSGLGERSSGWLRVLPTGIVLRRPSYDDVFVPAEALLSARVDTAHAGRFIGPQGVVVIGWRHDDRLLETGFHGEYRSRHAEVVAAVSELIGVPDVSVTTGKETQ